MGHTDKCRLCGSKDLIQIYGHVRDSKNLSVMQCKNCSLIFLDSFKHITDDFYKNGGMLPKKFDIAKWQERAYTDDIRRYKLTKNKLENKILIDYGAGAGGFLKLAKKSVLQEYAVEIDTNLQKYLIKSDINVSDDINKCPKADIITLFHVLEHKKYPVEFLTNLKNNLTSKESEIIIEVPNGNDALISLYKSKAFLDYTWWSCHLYTYNINSLTLLARMAGYKINYIRKVQRYGLINHLYWLFKGKPSGHLLHPKLNNKLINKLYGFILSGLNKTDTIMMSISKE